MEHRLWHSQDSWDTAEQEQQQGKAQAGWMSQVCKSLPGDPAVHESPDGALHTDLKVLYLNGGTSTAFEEITM